MKWLAQLSGINGYTIHRAFRKHRGYTPMQFLRDVRMRNARQRLMHAGPSESVTSIALACGFSHLGRFANAYQGRFGESPSQSLKHAISSSPAVP